MKNGGVSVKAMEVASCSESLPEVVAAVSEVAARLGMSTGAAEEVAIALTEAVNNAIFHGNGGVREKRVCIRFEEVGGGLCVRVRDTGPGFNPAAVPDPLAEENLLKPSGRGLLLMRAMVDEVRHVFEGGGTEVVLLKRID